ncbi:InlB B-repeat-containing protein [Butyrivibrio sp. AE3009]|uniref:InlB B-repeat-containing protein n=1 Tax=Butyrivibrio sp. AE3009 TaxID=1280666 RepID=UPI0003B47E4E|nr:InlB B-repeat-containing protein [Butyrivibrio sp. AE3009]
MKSKLIGKLLSFTLSAALAVTAFSTPAYAAETDLGQAEEIAFEEVVEEESLEDAVDNTDETFEETTEAEETEEVSFEEELVEDIDEVEEQAEEATTEAEEVFAVEEEDADFEAVSSNNSNTITVIFHSNYRGNDTTVKRFFDKTNLDENPINYTSLFTVGYDKLFIGWELNGEFKETVTEKEVVDYAVANALKTVDIYAQWESFGTYNVTFNLGEPDGCLQKNHYGYGDGEIVALEIGEPIILSGDEFLLPGYELVGWTIKDSTGNTVKTLKKASGTIPSLYEKYGDSFTFTPVWKLGTYTITYDFNGGTSKSKNKVTYKLDSTTVNAQPLLNYVADADDKYGFVINTATPEVTRDGYTFTGWNGGYTRSYGGNSFNNLTLKANWTANKYTVNWDANGGYLFGESVYSSNYSISTSFNNYKPYRDGYTFKGWKTKVKGKDKTFKATDKIALKDIDRGTDGTYSLTAVWEAEKNKIAYYLAGGTIKKAPKTYKSGEETVIPNPTMDGYKFNGWVVEEYDYEAEEYIYIDAEEAGIIKDGKLTATNTGYIYLEASWSPLYYDITFKNNDGTDLTDTEGNPVTVSGFTGVYYNQTLDFAKAATQIEATGALGDKGIAGFAVKANAKKPTYKLNVNYYRFLQKSYNGEGTTVPVTLYVVTQEKVNRITYNLNGGKIKNATYTFTAKNVAKDLAIKATAARTGWKFVGWTADEAYDAYVVKNADGYVTAVKAGTAANIVLDAVYADQNKYTITLMPGAADVKNAAGQVVDSKKGEQFTDGETTEFGYTDYTHYLDSVVWTREGYYFSGFYTDSKFKKYAYSTAGLGNGKSTNVKVYAKWNPIQVEVEIDDNALVYRGTEPRTVYEGYLNARFSGYNFVKYGTKDLTLKAVKADGYIFKGYKIINEITDDSGIEYTDTTKTYVKKIKKTNKVDIILRPVFEEITYKVMVNPNGGKYNDSTAKALVAEKVYYTQTLDEVYADITAKAKRSGYTIGSVSTTKDYKGNIRQTGINSDESRFTYFKARLATKQDATVVLNVLWNAVSTDAPVIKAQNTGADGDTISLYSSASPTENYRRVVFEYSTSADFSNNVKSYTWDKLNYTEEGIYEYPTVTVTPGKNYYVRVRQEIIDSTGEYFAGKWSNTVMVAGK